MTEHHFVWLELRTGKPAAVREFYEQLFDWEAQDAGPAASMVVLGEDAVGVSILPADKGHGADWLPFVSVPDVKAATRKAAKLGARVLEDSVQTPHGLRSVLEDPSGARLALFQLAR